MKVTATMSDDKFNDALNEVADLLKIAREIVESLETAETVEKAEDLIANLLEAKENTASLLSDIKALLPTPAK